MTPAKSLMMQIRWSWPAVARQSRRTLSSWPGVSPSGAEALRPWLARTTAASSASTRARLRNGRMCSTRWSPNTRAPTRSPACRAIQADNAASSAAVTDLKLRREPKYILMRWSTSSRVGRSRSSVKVRTKGLP
ncbi:hypothetical protein D9M69_686850 [compost metagenome]